MDKMNLEDFLNAHVLKNNDEITHTEFGKFVNRKFHIPKEKHVEFLNLYYKNVIKVDRTHNIIERQLIEKSKDAGVVLVDLDFRFDASHTDRIYTQNHIDEFIQYYLAEFETLFELDQDTHFPIFVLEKPSPRVEIKSTGNFVKDGLHFIFGIALDKVYHEYIRDKVVKRLEQWTLPIINNGGWEDVVDKSISSGSNGWLLLNSKKRDDQSHYQLKQVYDVYYDEDAQAWVKNKSTEPIETFLSKNHKLLSPRYCDRPIVITKEAMLPAIQNYKKTPEVARAPEIDVDDMGYRIPVQVVRMIKNREELKLCLDAFLDSVTSQISLYEFKEAYEYTMTLPSTYYDDGSYNKWVKVSFALRNISVHLLIVWIAFSAQSTTFDYASVGDMCDRWTKLVPHHDGVTKKSLMYWSANDAPEAYAKVEENTVDYYLDATIDSITVEQLTKKKNAKGSTDFDIARVLHPFKKKQFVAISIKQNEWLQYTTHRWSKNDCGTSLRKIISTDLRDLYREKATRIWQTSLEFAEDSDERKVIKLRADKVLDIALTLGSTKDKDNIMKEARELFYQPDFLDKLDSNKYLLCFKNGVVDFKEKVFRRGYPEDYISKCTGLDYVSLTDEHAPLIAEINDYMDKLFPEKELCEYMWDHLASVLIGDTAINQCLHYYTGIGQNGKSILVKLMQQILGEYAVDLDVKFFTQERPKLGQSSPELYSVIGARYAITAEPSEGDKMNEGPMKQITGGTDKMSCRPPYGQLITFTPQVHCVIMANYYLEVKTTDHGTWRRIRTIEFKSLFCDNPVTDDPDRPYQFKKVSNFDEKFAIWAPVFMSLLVQRAFKTGGEVKLCKIVELASNKYRKNQDVLAEFLDDRVMAKPGVSVTKSEIVTAFNDWYRLLYATKINKSRELYNIMDKCYTTFKTPAGTVAGWKDVGLRNDNDELSVVTDGESV